MEKTPRTPKISVIILTHNRAHLLPRTVASVRAQTMSDLECILVNDRSTDNTPALIRQWEQEDDRIRSIQGIGTPGELDVLRNIGIRAARGEYTAMLDDDDEWLPEKLEKQLALFEKDVTGKLGFVGCDALRCKPDGSEQLRTEPHEGNVLHNLLIKNIVHNGSIALMKTSALREVGMFDEKLIACENRDLWIRLSAAGYTYGYVREPLVKIHLHDSNHHYSWNTPRQKRRALDFEYMFNKHRGLWKQEGLYSEGLRALGIYLLASKETSHARQHFIEAIRVRWTDYKAWTGFLLSCFGIYGSKFYWWYTRTRR